MTKRKPSQAKYIAVLMQECLLFGVSVRDAHSRSRRQDHALPRFKAWARLRDEGYSTPGIGMCAGRDHSTIVCGSRRAAQIEYPARASAHLEKRGGGQ